MHYFHLFRQKVHALNLWPREAEEPRVARIPPTRGQVRRRVQCKTDPSGVCAGICNIGVVRLADDGGSAIRSRGLAKEQRMIE